MRFLSSTQVVQPAFTRAGKAREFLAVLPQRRVRGRNIGDAFARSRRVRLGLIWRTKNEGAKWAIYYATANKQVAQLDGDGDGHRHEFVDDELAEDWYIGTAFMTGADNPTIGSVMPDTAALISNAVLLWVSEVTGVEGISNVRRAITPPSYDG